MYPPKHKVTIRQRILWAVEDTISVMSLVVATVGVAIIIGEGLNYVIS